MRQVIARSPAGLKSLLLQVGQVGVQWEEFLRQAENAAWVVFPDKIVGRINTNENEVRRSSYVENKKDFEDMVSKVTKRSGIAIYMEKGNHSTKFCKVVKLMESKGWKRNKNDLVTRDIRDLSDDSVSKCDLNKKDDCYFGNKLNLKGEIHFLLNLRLMELKFQQLLILAQMQRY
jgi:hypothetical protein